MKLPVLLISGILLYLSTILAAGPASAAPQERPTGGMKCEKRTADAEPPREMMPTLHGFDDRQEKIQPARKLEPVCPEGEVPMMPRDPRHLLKGNPMIGPYAQPGPAHGLPGDFVNKNLLLPFDQVYWKRDGAVAPSHAKFPNGTGDAPCNGMAWFDSCYFYASASELRVADGGGMTLQIEAPTLVLAPDAGGVGHSIGQIAGQGPGTATGSLDDVEMGFSVSQYDWGDTHPHLFVYHFNDGMETCYNSCEWNQVSPTYYPGMDLTPLVGERVYIGWVQYKGAWWGWFNDQWLGYIKDSAYLTSFTKTAQIQWYGEIASDNGIPPMTQMGNGEFPAKTTAASMSTLCDVDAKAWVCYYRDTQSTGATHPSYYDIQNHTAFGAIRYGGPGQ